MSQLQQIIKMDENVGRAIAIIYYNGAHLIKIEGYNDKFTEKFILSELVKDVEFNLEEILNALSSAKKSLNEITNSFEIRIASYPDRENLVSEITYNGFHWVEINQELDVPTIIFYNHPNKKSWEFDFDEAFFQLKKARQRLE